MQNNSRLSGITIPIYHREHSYWTIRAVRTLYISHSPSSEVTSVVNGTDFIYTWTKSRSPPEDSWACPGPTVTRYSCTFFFFTAMNGFWWGLRNTNMELVFCLWLVLVSSQISVGTHRHGKCLDILVKVSS